MLCTSRLHWPAWQRPTSWSSWRHFLHHISARGRLLQELGPWVAPSHQVWQWFYEASQDVVYLCPSTDQWFSCSRLTSSRTTRQSRTLYSPPQPCGAPSPFGVFLPTTIKTMANQSICSLHSASELVLVESSATPDLWSPEVAPLEFSDTPTYYQRMIGPHPPSAFQCLEVAEALREDNELLGCSDGSYVDTTGQCYHGWILASEVRRTIAEGSGPGMVIQTSFLHIEQN